MYKNGLRERKYDFVNEIHRRAEVEHKKAAISSVERMMIYGREYHKVRYCSVAEALGILCKSHLCSVETITPLIR